MLNIIVVLMSFFEKKESLDIDLNNFLLSSKAYSSRLKDSSIILSALIISLKHSLKTSNSISLYILEISSLYFKASFYSLEFLLFLNITEV